MLPFLLLLAWIVVTPAPEPVVSPGPIIDIQIDHKKRVSPCRLYQVEGRPWIYVEVCA